LFRLYGAQYRRTRILTRLLHRVAAASLCSFGRFFPDTFPSLSLYRSPPPIHTSAVYLSFVILGTLIVLITPHPITLAHIAFPFRVDTITASDAAVLPTCDYVTPAFFLCFLLFLTPSGCLYIYIGRLLCNISFIPFLAASF